MSGSKKATVKSEDVSSKRVGKPSKTSLKKPALFRALQEGEEDGDLISLIDTYLTHENTDRREVMRIVKRLRQGQFWVRSLIDEKLAG